MRPSDLKANAYDCLLIGIRRKRFEQVTVIDLCRQFDARLLFREGEVIVVDIGGCSAAIDDLLAKLSRNESVTHLWRRGTSTAV